MKTILDWTAEGLVARIESRRKQEDWQAWRDVMKYIAKIAGLDLVLEPHGDRREVLFQCGREDAPRLLRAFQATHDLGMFADELDNRLPLELLPGLCEPNEPDGLIEAERKMTLEDWHLRLSTAEARAMKDHYLWMRDFLLNRLR